MKQRVIPTVRQQKIERKIMYDHEDFLTFREWSYEFVRRRQVDPPGAEFTIDMNSELSIPGTHVDVECFVNGVRTILPTGRLSFDMNLPDSSDVHIRLNVREPLILFEYAYAPGALEMDGFYCTKNSRPKLFRHSKQSLHTYMSSCREITIGTRPFSVDTLLRYPNITSLKIEMRGNEFDWGKFQFVVRSMTWLKELHILFFERVDPYIFELFECLPEKVTFQGRYTLVALDRLSSVRDLTIKKYGPQTDPIESELGPYLSHLRSLTCFGGTLQLDLTELRSLTSLTLNGVHCTYRDAVAIGRLLRRNQLESLRFERCVWISKRELRPILQPLLEGVNASLRHLGVVSVNMSRHMTYMLSDVVNFCPTLTSLSVDAPGEEFSQDRMLHFEDVRNTRIAKTYVPVGSPLWRVFDLVESELAVFLPTYRRENRRWRRTGLRQLVCAPFEFVF